MIKLLRIDERLVHGQVAVVWSRFLGVNRIVVADDEAAGNETQKIAMQMAVPKDTKLTVTTVEKAVALLNDPRSEGLKIFLVVRNPENARKLTQEVKGIHEVNVGNYGRMSGEDESSKVTLERGLYATKDEMEIFNSISADGVRVYYQITPQEKATELGELIARKAGK